MTARMSARKRRRNARMIVTVDKQDFVVSAQREPSDAQTESAIKEIHRADSTPAIQTKVCKGPYHRRNGAGTELPMSEFRWSTHFKRWNSTCNGCLDSKLGKLPMGEVTPVVNNGVPESLPPPTLIIETTRPINPKWRITIIRSSVIEVYAADFLDAAAQAGDGEVVKVERLD